MEGTPTICAPDISRFLCITGQDIQTVLPYIMVALLLAGIYAIIRVEYRKHWGYSAKQGTDPDQNATVPNASYQSNTSNFSDTSRTYIHTKDPQDHAKAMIPNTAIKKD